MKTILLMLIMSLSIHASEKEWERGKTGIVRLYGVRSYWLTPLLDYSAMAMVLDEDGTVFPACIEADTKFGKSIIKALVKADSRKCARVEARKTGTYNSLKLGRRCNILLIKGKAKNAKH